VFQAFEDGQAEEREREGCRESQLPRPALSSWLKSEWTGEGHVGFSHLDHLSEKKSQKRNTSLWAWN